MHILNSGLSLGSQTCGKEDMVVSNITGENKSDTSKSQNKET
jgi:hypothetical protein